MKKIMVRTAPASIVLASIALASIALVAGVGAAPASAAEVRCGDPGNVKVHLTGGGLTQFICFAGIGRNAFNKVGVDYVEAGRYGGTVIVRGEPFDFEPGQTIRFRPVVNPNVIDITTIRRPS